MDIFSSKQRLPIPCAQYQDLYRTYSKGSLRFSDHVEPVEANFRKTELEKAENKFGFVYAAERLWLESGVPHSYAEWLLEQLNKSFFNRPLAWGNYLDEDYYTTENFKDIWTGKSTTGLSNIPFWDLLKHEQYVQAMEGKHLSVSISGKRNSVSPKHLVSLFDQLFNLPYLFLHNAKLGLNNYFAPEQCCQWDNWELTLVEPENPTVTNLIVSDFASSGHYTDEYRFHGWEAESIKEPPGNSADLKTIYESDPFTDWVPAQNHFYMPQRILRKHQNKIPEDILKQHLHKRPHLSAVLITTVECACGLKAEHALKFYWGRLIDFPEYNIGDTIMWDGIGIGYPELPNVFVHASSEQGCHSCGQRIETLLSLKENKIIGFAPELIPKIKYLFQGPFISDELVLWNNYQQDWINKAWAELLADNPNSEFQACQSIEWKDNAQYPNKIQYLVLLSKYREKVSNELFKRSIMLFGINRMNEASISPSSKSKLKTCAILHLEIEGIKTLAKFYWGSLLDFPEYEIGDEIRWSEYSIGEQEIKEAVHARAYVDGSHHLELIIHIDNNRITSFEILEDRLEDSQIKPFAYTGSDWLPWLVIPDKYFINSHRTHHSYQTLSHFTSPEHYANVF